MSSRQRGSEKIFKPGGIFANIVITVDDEYVKYRGAYGDKLA